MWCKTKQREGSRPVDPRVSSHHDRLNLLDARRNSGEINDHHPEEIRDTEFGLPSSNMKGAFGNEGALRFYLGRGWPDAGFFLQER